MCEKQPVVVNPIGPCNWAPSFRDGLPTPPADMTGVAYNATAAANYGGKPDAFSCYPYPTKALNIPRTNSDFVPSVMVPGYSSRSRSTSAKSGSVSESATSNSSSRKSVPSFLEIPSTISATKGNLADFAAQVRIARSICRDEFYEQGELTCFVDDMSLLV